RALGKRELFGRLAEVAARRRFRSIKALAEINAVQIQLENFLFREPPLDFLREKNLEHLPLISPLPQRKRVPRELLRERARTLPDAARAPVFHAGASHAVKVDAVMPKKAIVLRGDHRLDHLIRELVEGNRIAIFKKNAAEDVV